LVGNAVIFGILLLWSCAEQVEPIPEMPGNELLTRISLDTRGIRPTAEEYAAVEQDPSRLEEYLESYLYDERFGERVRSLFSEIYLTRAEAVYFSVDDFSQLDGVSNADFLNSVGEEALYILDTIASEDQPLTELVVADWTMANPITAAIWPLDYPADGEGWQLAHYTDGRPAAGVLSTNSLWWRYTTTSSNANRKRANAVSRMFLCHDYLARPIKFDRSVSILDEASVSNALKTNPGCVGCHVSLDPLAAYFFGYWAYNDDVPSEVSLYHPDRERLWSSYLDVSPAYYGEPGYSLRDLGVQIASDSRFSKCLTKQSFELLLRRESLLADGRELEAHRLEMMRSNMTLRSLFRSIMGSRYYRAGRTDIAGAVSKKMVTPELMASQVEDLTGFRFVDDEGFDQLLEDSRGFLTLAGGADGYYATRHATSPNTTVLLVQERLAEAAAEYVVRADGAADAPKLFTELRPTASYKDDPEGFVRQVQVLHFRFFGSRVEASGEEVGANVALWKELYGIDNEIERAWIGLVSALLRDPDMLFY
jgi:hypothetical protein